MFDPDSIRTVFAKGLTPELSLEGKWRKEKGPVVETEVCAEAGRREEGAIALQRCGHSCRRGCAVRDGQ